VLIFYLWELFFFFYAHGIHKSCVMWLIILEHIGFELLRVVVPPNMQITMKYTQTFGLPFNRLNLFVNVIYYK